MIPSYTSIVAYGHKSLELFFEGTIYVTEKVDGSQFSFRKTADGVEFRSKNTEVWAENPGMFSNATQAITERASLLVMDWIYRSEYLQKPHHNALCYARVPRGHVILFDVDTGDQDYLSPVDLEVEARRMDLECVPCLMRIEGQHDKITLQELMNLLETPSVLGDQKIEGIVLKNYGQFGAGHKTMMAKLVRQDFKEVNKESWRKQNPPSGEFMSDLAASYCTTARWMKAVQHLTESGSLEGSPRDIPTLMQEVARDVLAECADEMKEELFKYFWKKHGSRVVTRGLAVWWKQQIAEQMVQEITE